SISPTQPFSPYPPLPPSPDPSSPGDDLNLTVIHRMREDESERDSESGDESASAILRIGVEGPVPVKVPFSPADLVIWKRSAGTYKENPDKVARVVKMIMKTQNPDWDDIQVILDTLMDSTEKEMVLKAAKEKARKDIRHMLIMGTLDDNFPAEDPG
ncbi:hypothetical protein DV515_00018507, partial [Chloebia gouldiae]